MKHFLFTYIGEFHQLIRDLRTKRKPWSFKYFQMTPDVFDELLDKLSSKLTKLNSQNDAGFSAERLAVTLRYV